MRNWRAAGGGHDQAGRRTHASCRLEACATREGGDPEQRRGRHPGRVNFASSLQLAWGGERRGPHDRVAVAEEARRPRGSRADVSEARVEQVRAMGWRLQPCSDHVTCAHLAPGACEQVLAEARVPVASRLDGCRHRGSARRVRELDARCDAFALQRGCAPQRGPLCQPAAPILHACPVEETRDRTRLDRSPGGRVIRRRARTGGCQVRTPCTSCSIRVRHPEAQDRHERNQDGRRHGEPGSCCRSCRRHNSYRESTSLALPALIGGGSSPEPVILPRTSGRSG